MAASVSSKAQQLSGCFETQQQGVCLMREKALLKRIFIRETHSLAAVLWHEPIPCSLFMVLALKHASRDRQYAPKVHLAALTHRLLLTAACILDVFPHLAARTHH